MIDRRPIASRDTGWAHALTQLLARHKISPNQISIVSMGFAVLAGLTFYFGVQLSGAGRVVLLLLAALFCQLRLICNLLDGLVAVEAGKGEADGAFWNEAPDRVSDTVIFVGLGYGLGMPSLGWTAAAMAISTAYIRELGRATTGDNDFSGPMAKPHRMAVVTFAGVLACFTPIFGGAAGGNGILIGALWIVTVGALITSIRRSSYMIARLRA